MSHCWFLTLNKTFFGDEKKVCCVFFHHREETCIWARFNLTPIPYSFRTQCDNAQAQCVMTITIQLGRL